MVQGCEALLTPLCRHHRAPRLIRFALQLFPYLIGQKGRTRQRIEQDTGAEIAFPSRGDQVGASD